MGLLQLLAKEPFRCQQICTVSPANCRSPGGISSISDTPAVPPKSVFSGSTFGQKFSFSESDKAMNNNDGGCGGTADPSRLAPPDAGTTELVNDP